MKLSCTRENLFQGLAITSHISGKNTNLPILNNVLLRADIAGLKLTSTNLEITITCTVRGKVEQQGEYTVPSKLFADFVSLLPNERVDLDLLDKSLAVVCEKTKTKINGIPANEFPLVPPVTGGVAFKIPVSELDRALGQVLFAVATNEARQALTGVSMHFDGVNKQLVLAATDSYRLAERTIPLSVQAEGERRVIVPARTLGELRRIFSVLRDSVEVPEDLEVELTESQILFRYGTVEISSRTIDGVYPDYRQIVPKTSVTEVVVNRAAFAQAVKRTSLFSKTGLFDVRMEFDPTNKIITLSANDATRGENTVAVDGEVSGGGNAVVLNFRYLLDGVGAISSDNVTIRLIDGTNPCLLLPFEMPSEAYLYIVMPIRQ
ncbi:MAG: polymerase III subunit beta protein [Candidatus Uhrbacteria bacterium GW2011_GWD2_52_7]|uniref:Beta sliding clamp n=1 Tax=Candidatus Uhrbacteria bacterium GW2011_GWD2_52_7 TaxID=1618989 RepID=A0A0G1XDG0_9BACT|nr:MAG: polymerase III subunit beta protein [Candidatus Uhrbacteria bacterium GW2011_GWD2_52_7]